MEFNLLSWWHRKRIQATVQLSGRPMQFHHVTNPYHAVSIKAGTRCHQTAQTAGAAVRATGGEGRITDSFWWPYSKRR